MLCSSLGEGGMCSQNRATCRLSAVCSFKTGSRTKQRRKDMSVFVSFLLRQLGKIIKHAEISISNERSTWKSLFSCVWKEPKYLLCSPLSWQVIYFARASAAAAAAAVKRLNLALIFEAPFVSYCCLTLIYYQNDKIWERLIWSAEFLASVNRSVPIQKRLLA